MASGRDTGDYLILARHGVREDYRNPSGYAGRDTRPCDPDLNQADIASLSESAARMVDAVPAGLLRQRGVTIQSSSFRRCVQTSAVYGKALQSLGASFDQADASSAPVIHIQPYIGEDGRALRCCEYGGSLIMRGIPICRFSHSVTDPPPVHYQTGADNILINARDALATRALTDVTVEYAAPSNAAKIEHAMVQECDRNYLSAAALVADRIQTFRMVAIEKPGHAAPIPVVVTHRGIAGELLGQLTGMQHALTDAYFADMGGAVVLHRDVAETRWRIIASTCRDCLIKRGLVIFLMLALAAAICYAVYTFYLRR